MSCFCWPVQQQTLQRKAKGTIGQVRMWRVWMPFMCCLTNHLYFFISLSNAWLAGYVMSGFETMPTVFSLGFHHCKRKLKLDNEKQWKIYLKWIELKTRTFQLLYARENNKKISQEARGSNGGEGEWGEGGVVAGFDQDANKCMTSTGISHLVISFAL